MSLIDVALAFVIHQPDGALPDFIDEIAPPSDDRQLTDAGWTNPAVVAAARGR